MNKQDDNFDVLRHVDAIKTGDNIELDLYRVGLRKATVRRVYRVGESLHFAVDVASTRETLLGRTINYTESLTLDYIQMARSLVTDKEVSDDA